VFQQPAGDIDAKPTVGRSEALHVNRRTRTRSKSKLDRYRILNWLGDIGRADQFNYRRSRQVVWSGHLGSGAVARIFLGSYEVPLRLSDGRDSQHDGREQPAETKVYTASSDHHAFSNIMALIDSLAFTAFGQGYLVFWCRRVAANASYLSSRWLPTDAATSQSSAVPLHQLRFTPDRRGGVRQPSDAEAIANKGGE
jgi:hypothetical protein